MIVDEAEADLEMAEDPFLEAGISIPEDLPYSTQLPRKKVIFNSIS